MKIFISWSKERSERVAVALAEWLPNVIQGLDPWLSRETPKGAEFFSELGAAIDSAHAGIVCVTPENRREPWLLFEAGALAKKFGARQLVCTYLFGIEPVQVDEPLARYQHTRPTREDTLRLMRTINSAIGAGSLTDERLRLAFDRWWPDLSERLASIPASQPEVEAPTKSERQLLEEIILMLREQRQHAEGGVGRPVSASPHWPLFSALLDTLEQPLEPTQMEWDGERLTITASTPSELTAHTLRGLLGAACRVLGRTTSRNPPSIVLRSIDDGTLHSYNPTGGWQKRTTTGGWVAIAEQPTIPTL